MDTDFLHAINIADLTRETGLDVHGLAELVGVDEQSVYRWSWPKEKKGNRPKYNSVFKLFKAGATVETLFGVEYKGNKKEQNENMKLTDEDLSRAFLRAAQLFSKKKEVDDEKK